MSREECKLERDLCRCCHTEGAFVGLLSTGHTMKKEIEVYTDMLRTCLNIELMRVEGTPSTPGSSICELCASRIHDAHSFRQQVLECEKRFRDMYTSNLIKVCDIKEDIKEELPDSDVDVKKEIGSEIVTVRLRQIVKKRPKKTLKDCTPKEKDTKTKPKRGRRPTFTECTLIGDSYKCTQCDKFYKCRKAVKSHFRIVHLKQKRVNTFPCTQCPKTFISLTRLKTHKLDEHDIDDRLKCNACDKMFNLKRALLKHMNVYHMMGERITCSMCDYECYDKESLRKHLFKHKKSKDYHCQFCKKSFLRKSNLQFHERIHTGDKRKVCAECGQAFVQKASLNYHMAKYHPEVKF